MGALVESIGGLSRWAPLLIGPLLVGATGVLPPRLVTVGPAGTLEEQITYLRSTWPDQFAIAVVEAIRAPSCQAKEDGTTTCGARVRPRELILVRWLSSSPPAPGAGADPYAK
jgi:hypothetical protein